MNKDFTGLMLILLIGIFAIAAATLVSVNLKAEEIKNNTAQEVKKLERYEIDKFYTLSRQLKELEEALDKLTPEEETETMVSLNEVIETLEKMRGV